MRWWLREQAAQAGFDAVLVAAPPQWERLTERGSDAVLQGGGGCVAAAGGAGERGGVAGVSAECDEIAELALHRNVVGVYDEGLTVERYRAIADATKDVKREVVVTTVFAPVTRRMAAAGEVGEGVCIGVRRWRRRAVAVAPR